MRTRTKAKLQAIVLRKRGYSVNEIAAKVGASKGSVSPWVRNVPLSSNAKRRLAARISAGQLASIENKRRRRQALLLQYAKGAQAEVARKFIDIRMAKIICALLYWCEGAKDDSGGLYFTNSDPQLIKTFLSLLRKGFEIDESKFRVIVHVHEYHDEKKQIHFWSKVTEIPAKQFSKPYRKTNTGIRIREGYQGCASIRYGRVDMARQLHALAKAFLTKTI